MKIGITCYPNIGGSGVVATELGKKLAQRGHEVHFITSSMPFRLNQMNDNIYVHEVEVNNYAVFQYPPYDLTLSTKISEVISEYELDIIHMHYAVPHAICGHLAISMANRDTKMVTTLHGTDITVLGYDSSLKPAIKFGIEKSDAVTAVSQSLIEDTDTIIKPNQDIELIYNFVDEEKFSTPKIDLNKVKKSLCISDEIVISHVSNFRSVKRVEDIIHTFYKVQFKKKSVLLLIGDGPMLFKAKTLVKALGIEKKVRFIGKQEEITHYYHISDFFLLMSEKESFGLVLLEAMYGGAICIATNAGGMKEVIHHNENGILVDVGDTNQASDYIIDLISDPEKMKKIKENMKQILINKFSTDPIVRKYESLYLGLLNKGSK
ncbi:N-acetyl-alpha-D-glucosaminyl L-malate synthase BshA [Abyssicoccus albus]|uniref:N-acetyl-alpha-D-glucosaminyl L-malate synthase BshA n=1 Tax=Abyssicoccus albus TaxID=1817405 RepID=A0A3N5CFK8_9BACL|nr:N-acetyl-alpha-D-glucosaminyl L-malate synthase BshA [Abyssicoccus albus]RPF58015.1 N-acetyl-alpha-D-glucosaminyl L-malate synthase BshA [Abyssicoccus albus]